MSFNRCHIIEYKTCLQICLAIQLIYNGFDESTITNFLHCMVDFSGFSPTIAKGEEFYNKKLDFQCLEQLNQNEINLIWQHNP